MIGGKIIGLVIGLTLMAIAGTTSLQISGDHPTESSTIHVSWYWEDKFNEQEKRKIEDWLNSVTEAIESTLGVYPFEVKFYLHRRDSSGEPVPWAHTERHDGQGVHFYIDPDYPLVSFMDDWTAPHEISHLSIPHLGREHTWFAEGYASFMQYQLMEQMGIYDSAQKAQRYEAKIKMALPYYQKDESMITVAADMKKAHNYPAMYWGGAIFFLKLDQRITEKTGSSFSDLIKRYQDCCRLEDNTLEELLASWDGLLGIPVCSNLLKECQTVPAIKFVSFLETDYLSN